MKKNLISSIAVIGALISALSQIQAATFTWDGGGTDNNWNTGANWVGDSAPAATSQSLIFAGTTRLTPNNTNVTSIAGLTFAADAGAFTLSGNAFTIAGTGLVNLSGHNQVIENNLTVSNNTFNTGAVGVQLKGTFSNNNLLKIGTGALILSGATTAASGVLRVNQGKLVVDAASGGSLTFGTGQLWFGDSTGAPLTSINQGGTLELRGKATGAASALSVPGTTYMVQTSGANRIIVDSSGNSAGASITFSALSRSGLGTFNVDLSSTNSSFTITNTSTGTANGIILIGTVTKGGVTGFAAISGTTANVGSLTRLDLATIGSLASNGNGGTLNRKTSGDLVLTTANQAVNSLTISGGGSLAGTNLQTTSILMQEGAGNYTINNAFIGSNSAAALYLHQYSTSGSLIINSSLAFGAATTGYQVVKTGSGKVIYGGSSPNLWGVTDVQAGELQHNGSLAGTSTVYVRHDATLSGSGIIGGGTVTAGATRYTPVSVFTGGTLDGTNSTGNALHIIGSLLLDTGSTFQMSLTDTAFAALSVTNPAAGDLITLAGDLVLTLNYAPNLNDKITLLTTDGNIAGQFVSINGSAFAPDSIFALTYNSQLYTFLINYDSDSVFLTTFSIPEPSSSSLLLGGAVAAFFLFRRRRRI